jgi:hypothetical protein
MMGGDAGKEVMDDGLAEAGGRVDDGQWHRRRRGNGQKHNPRKRKNMVGERM